MGEEAGVDEAGGLRAAVAVVDADVGGRGGGDDLALVLEGRVGLDDGDGELTGGVGLEVKVPEEAVAATEAAEAPPQTRSHHRCRVVVREVGFWAVGGGERWAVGG